MEKKLTIVDKFGMVKDFLVEKGADEELVAFIEDRAKAQAKKAENRKPSKEQKANEGLKDRIVEVLAEATEPMTATAVLNADPEAFKSLPKVTALLTALKNEDRIVREQDKKKIYFKVVAE